MKRRLPVIYILLFSAVFLFGSRSAVFGQGTDIISYSFPEETGPATIGSGTVDIEVEYGTNLIDLIATFTLSDSAIAEIGEERQYSGITANDFSGGAVIYTITDTTDASTQDWDINVSVALNDSTDILTFTLPEQTGPAVIDANNHTIDIEVDFGTDLTSLTPTFALSTGATSNPTSGTTSDYSSPFIITVTAEDGIAIQDWTVNISEAPSNETDILTFTFPEQTGPAIIDDVNHTIDIEVDYGTNLTSLTPTFTLSTGATSSPTSGTTSDYSSPFIIAVTAEDGITNQNWTVNVSEASNTENDILTYSLPGQTGPATINNGNHTVTVTVPYGTTVTSLIATFTLSSQATATVGAVIQVSGSTPNNFTNPVIYAVEAGEGTTQNWTVTVNFAPNTETDILTYSLDGFTGTVNAINHTVSVTVPYGTDVTDMVATFTCSDSTCVKTRQAGNQE